MLRRKRGLKVLALLLACGAAGAAAAADSVKIGVMAPFSGPFARWGTQFREGIEVWQKQHGKSVDGIPIEVVYRDTGGPAPAKARQLAQELILRDKVQYLGGLVFTPNALAIADLISEAKMPTVIFNAATAVIVRKSPYFIRVSQTIPQVAAPIGEWAAKNGIKTAVTAVSGYGPGFDGEEYFSKAFKAGGGKILESIRMPLSTTDFSPFFERVLKDKPDALFIFGPGGPPTVGMINTWSARLKPAGIKLLCTAETQQIDLPKIGPAALGVVSAFHYTETVDNPLNKALWADLHAMFGKDAVPDLATVQAYDGMHALYATVAKLGAHAKADDAIEFMRHLAFASPRGPIRIDPQTRDVVQNVYLRKVERRGGVLENINFETLPMRPDPWKKDHPEKK